MVGKFADSLSENHTPGSPLTKLGQFLPKGFGAVSIDKGWRQDRGKASARPVIYEVSKRRTLVLTDGLQAFLARRRASEAFVAGRAGLVCRARP
jgi:hypothetical protein